ncbi:MAG: hypothetical protein NTX61_15895 [Bacteroidetes bacterium]|nr:hypothetical protein [Bacteroidota bacterium]
MKTIWKPGILVILLVAGFIVLAQQLPPRCGKWRWNIKTMTDQQGPGLLLKTPVKSSIDRLVVEVPPKVLHASNRYDAQEPRMSGENQVVEIIAYVILVKHEKDDSDFHFVLQSPHSDQSMVGEIPDPDCTTFDNFPQLRSHFTKTRQDGQSVWNKLKKTRKSVKVRITGVTFWDGMHPKNNPTGASRYCREIHPILSIEMQ